MRCLEFEVELVPTGVSGLDYYCIVAYWMQIGFGVTIVGTTCIEVLDVSVETRTDDMTAEIDNNAPILMSDNATIYIHVNIHETPSKDSGDRR